MSSAIASKNLYDLLGNDPELDPDREPEPPTKVIDKPVQRTGKRNAGAEAPARDAAQSTATGRGGGFARGDRGGTVNNRDDGLRTDRHSNRTREPREYRGGEGRGGQRGRGRGRGGRGGAPRDDRHSHTGIGEHEKQAAHGWGGNDGNSEWADETAGERIAQAEAQDDAGFTPDTGAADPAFTNGPGGEGEVVGEDAVAEPEDKTKSYDAYLAELAEKRMALGGDLSVRQANEGSKQKFPEGKAFSREEQNFFIGGGGKAKKAKEIGDKKERVTLDGQYYQAPDAGDRGGRGRGRGGPGGRGRGEFRGDRGRGGGRGRGEFRGGARGDRGDRAPRGGSNFNANDESAFPALGGK